ncbi:hypothetical protein GF420_11225 [candidate division GN15 bacterium]|jgi:hypothetical protein|nr:hypothetical protein [candidate division GN15 bacterium]
MFWSFADGMVLPSVGIGSLCVSGQSMKGTVTQRITLDDATPNRTWGIEPMLDFRRGNSQMIKITVKINKMTGRQKENERYHYDEL